MNTTNILLGTTSILIVVAFALSFGGLTSGRESSESKQESKELQDEIAKLQAETRALQLSHARARSTRRALPPLPAAPAIPATPPPTPIQPGPASASTIDDEERQLLQSKIDALENTVSGLKGENEEIMSDRDEISIKQSMAARRIEMAMDMGTVLEASKEQAIVIYEPSANAPSYQPGKVLSIRRNNGIIGTIAIDSLDPSGKYIATLRPHGYAPDGYPDVLPGDTIIEDNS